MCMSIKFLDLNILHGKYLPTIIDFIHEGQFDVIHLQEVARGPWFPPEIDEDNFASLSRALSEYYGELAIAMKLKTDPGSYLGNAIFFKKNIKLLEKRVIWLKRYKELAYRHAIPIQAYPRNALCLELMIEGKPVYFINTHLAWGPTPEDRKYKLVQAKRLYKYLEKLHKPFILSGDFNLTPETQVVKMFDKLGQNLTKKSHVTNTLNPHIHRAKKLFPPGLAVDFIYTSNSVTVNDFKVIDHIDLSDHFGLVAEFTL